MNLTTQLTTLEQHDTPANRAAMRVREIMVVQQARAATRRLIREKREEREREEFDMGAGDRFDGLS